MKITAIPLLFAILAVGLTEIPPIANQLFPEIAAGLGYYSETHLITTEDGYINTYFRLINQTYMNQTNLPVVYLQHGLLDCGDDWVINDPELAPGLLIADAGFDVWVGNTRGNYYSLGHTTYNSSDPNSPYWLFSWQEMSQYDLPAAFTYINNITGQNIDYVGHSQGTVIMFAALSRQDPTILEYLKNFCALGPVAYVNHCTSPVVNLVKQKEVANIILRDGGKFLFVDHDQRIAMETACEVTPEVCADAIQKIADSNITVDNVARFDVFVGHPPAGTSAQNMYYWQQMSENDNFQMYDYGSPSANFEHYNQTTPPYYNLSAINVPIHLFAGTYDELADPVDVEHLISELTGSPNVQVHTYEYGHLTFMWGLDTPACVNDVLAVIQPGRTQTITN